MAKIQWCKVRDLSLAKAVRQTGFDITVFDDYGDRTKAEVKKLAIKELLRDLDNNFEHQWGSSLKYINKGVYVICLSRPFTIEYEKRDSEIIYIGQGNVMSRLESHFTRSLFSLMQSLNGTDFDFYISNPKRKGGGRASNYHKQIEFLLLKKFSETCGGKIRKYPLLNKNAGTDLWLEPDDGWDTPLKASGKKPQWALRATKHWEFEPLG